MEFYMSDGFISARAIMYVVQKSGERRPLTNSQIFNFTRKCSKIVKKSN